MIPIKLQGIFSNNMLFHTSPAHYSRKFGDKSLEESFRFFFMVTEIFFFFFVHLSNGANRSFSFFVDNTFQHLQRISKCVTFVG